MFANAKKHTDELTEAVKNNKKAIDEQIESTKKLEEEVQNKINNGMAEINSIQKLTDEMKYLVDANGKVKAGYEDRVKFILNEVNKAFGTEYSLIDGVISRNGKQVNSYEEVKKSIADVIKTKRLELTLEANKELYQDAIRKETELYQNRRTAQQQVGQTQEKLSKSLAKYGLTIDDMQNKTDKFVNMNRYINYNDWLDISEAAAEYETSINKLQDVNAAWDKNMETRRMYEEGYTALVTQDAEKIAKAQQNISAQYKDGTASIGDQLSKRLEEARNNREALEKNGQQITENQKQQLRAQYQDLTNTLIDETNRVKELTPDNARAWQLLAEEDAKLYNEAIQKVDKDTRFIIETAAGTVDMNSPEFATKWSNLAQNSEESFIKALSVLPSDTQGQIMTTVLKTTGMTPALKNAFNSLSYSGKTSFLNQLSSLPEDEKKKIQEAINGVYQKTGQMSEAGTAISDALKQSATSTKINMANNINFDTYTLQQKAQRAFKLVKEIMQNPLKINFSEYSDYNGYATGGFPDVGEMFIAREAGPELVGTIGNRTAVVNNEQIVAAVSQGVASAVSRVMGNQGGSYQLFIDGEQITNVVQQRINRNANIYGR